MTDAISSPWDWVTNEMEFEKLAELCSVDCLGRTDAVTTAQFSSWLTGLPRDIYTELREHMNNRVLESLADDHGRNYDGTFPPCEGCEEGCPDCDDEED